MRTIPSSESACEKIRGYLDSYISNELLVETNHEVLRHLESCPSCSAEAEARSRVKAQLKAAVASQNVPADLAAGWHRWAMAAAAAVVLSVGIWTSRTHSGMPDLVDRRGQDVFIQRVSQMVSMVLQPG